MRVQASFAVRSSAALRSIFIWRVSGGIGWEGFLFTELFELQALLALSKVSAFEDERRNFLVGLDRVRLGFHHTLCYLD